jgi:hypothetical protein
MARERKPPGTLLQKAYGIMDAYGLPRNYFVETSQDDCEIISLAPDVIPANPIPDTATRTSSNSDIKIMPSKPSDDKLKETDVQIPTQDKAPSESAKSPLIVDAAPKAPIETPKSPLIVDAAPKAPIETPQEVAETPNETEATQDVVANAEESGQISSPSNTKTEIPSDIKEEKV